MKKQYTTPTTEVVTITHETYILAGSPGIGTSSTGADKDGEVLSRQGNSFWDDDEE